MHSNFKNKGYFLARYVKLNEFGQNFTTLENCWISEAVHGLASCVIIKLRNLVLLLSFPEYLVYTIIDESETSDLVLKLVHQGR